MSIPVKMALDSLDGWVDVTKLTRRELRALADWRGAGVRDMSPHGTYWEAASAKLIEVWAEIGERCE